MAASEEEQPLPQLARTRANSDRRHRPAAVAEAGRARRQAASAGGLQPARDAQRARAAQPSPLLRCCQRGADAHCNCMHMRTHMAPIARAHAGPRLGARALPRLHLRVQRAAWRLLSLQQRGKHGPSALARSRPCGHPAAAPEACQLAQHPRENALAAPMPRRGCSGAPVSAQRRRFRRRRLRRLWPIQARASDATRRRAG